MHLVHNAVLGGMRKLFVNGEVKWFERKWYSLYW